MARNQNSPEPGGSSAASSHTLPAPGMWAAPTPSGPINGVVEVPGSKSQTNRLLVLAALADGPSVIQGALQSRDTDLMIAALQALGARITPGDTAGTLLVTPLTVGSGVGLAPVKIDVGLAGTVMRFIPPVAALVGGQVHFDGDATARTRPMKGLLDALADLGARIEPFNTETRGPDDGSGAEYVRGGGVGGGANFGIDSSGTGVHGLGACVDAYRGEGQGPDDNASVGIAAVNCYGAENGDGLGFSGADLSAVGAVTLVEGLPFQLETSGALQGGLVEVDASATSQFVSGLLLSAPRFPAGLTVRALGNVPSRPHIDMTVAALRERGVTVHDAADNTWVVPPGPISGGTMRVEPDLSNAAPFLAAALITGGSVTVPGWPSETTQPGALVPELLERMGAAVAYDGDHLTVSGPKNGPIHGIEIDLGAAGELVPTFAALAALADTPSRFTGVAHLRGHETDRLAALVAEINHLGGAARELPDGLEIAPAPLTGGVWHTYEDHRMATAGALIGLRVPGVQVENIGTTAKTLPDFPQMWEKMLNKNSRAEMLKVGDDDAA